MMFGGDTKCVCGRQGGAWRRVTGVVYGGYLSTIIYRVNLLSINFNNFNK